ncbi:hypothetical protein H4219_005948 [Mycoemilia scoparia]|uniref:Plasma membrane fusion protein PRM1 n=1 Tax=Mycoemilia scoparia TaxID=417184 RepID=A0A9W7ZLX8_9FUNG|nr:hypothetical protein H4219_005948 [Mycoemilia scoparia]
MSDERPVNPTFSQTRFESKYNTSTNSDGPFSSSPDASTFKHRANIPQFDDSTEDSSTNRDSEVRKSTKENIVNVGQPLPDTDNGTVKLSKKVAKEAVTDNSPGVKFNSKKGKSNTRNIGQNPYSEADIEIISAKKMPNNGYNTTEPQTSNRPITLKRNKKVIIPGNDNNEQNDVKLHAPKAMKKKVNINALEAQAQGSDNPNAEKEEVKKKSTLPSKGTAVAAALASGAGASAATAAIVEQKNHKRFDEKDDDDWDDDSATEYTPALDTHPGTDKFIPIPRPDHEQNQERGLESMYRNTRNERMPEPELLPEQQQEGKVNMPEPSSNPQDKNLLYPRDSTQSKLATGSTSDGITLINHTNVMPRTESEEHTRENIPSYYSRTQTYNERLQNPSIYAQSIHTQTFLDPESRNMALHGGIVPPAEQPVSLKPSHLENIPGGIGDFKPARYLSLKAMISRAWMTFIAILISVFGVIMVLEGKGAKDMAEDAQYSLLNMCQAVESAVLSNPKPGNLPYESVIQAYQGILQNESDALSKSLQQQYTVAGTLIAEVVQYYTKAIEYNTKTMLNGGLQMAYSAIQSIANNVAQTNLNPPPGTIVVPVQWVQSINNMLSQIPNEQQVNSQLNPLVISPFNNLLNTISSTFTNNRIDLRSELNLPDTKGHSPENSDPDLDLCPSDFMEDSFEKLGEAVASIYYYGAGMLFLIALIFIVIELFMLSIARKQEKVRIKEEFGPRAIAYAEIDKVNPEAINAGLPGGGYNQYDPMANNRHQGLAVYQYSKEEKEEMLNDLYYMPQNPIANLFKKWMKVDHSGKGNAKMWFLRYIGHGPSLSAFIVGLLTLIVVIVQIFCLNKLQYPHTGPIVKELNQHVLDFQSSMPMAVSEASGQATSSPNSFTNQVADELNKAIDKIESSISQTITREVQSANQQISSGLDQIANQYSQTLNQLFSNSPIANTVPDLVTNTMGTTIQEIKAVLRQMESTVGDVNFSKVPPALLKAETLSISQTSLNSTFHKMRVIAVGTLKDEYDDTTNKNIDAISDPDAKYSGGEVGHLCNRYVDHSKRLIPLLVAFIILWILVLIMGIFGLFSKKSQARKFENEKGNKPRELQEKQDQQQHQQEQGQGSMYYNDAQNGELNDYYQHHDLERKHEFELLELQQQRLTQQQEQINHIQDQHHQTQYEHKDSHSINSKRSEEHLIGNDSIHGNGHQYQPNQDYTQDHLHENPRYSPGPNSEINGENYSYYHPETSEATKPQTNAQQQQQQHQPRQIQDSKDSDPNNILL